MHIKVQNYYYNMKFKVIALYRFKHEFTYHTKYIQNHNQTSQFVNWVSTVTQVCRKISVSLV
jgi:hypothetical protein